MTPTNTIRKNLIYVLLLTALTMTGCWGGQQPKAYASQLTSSDSMSIQMGNYTLMKYHSDRLGFDINYPSFLYRQELPDDAGMQELFMMDDISVSFMVDSLHNVLRTSGQTLLAMGADDKWEYYSKVINSDTLRQVTIILRYYPEHAEAMEPLKEWVRDFQITP